MYGYIYRTHNLVNGKMYVGLKVSDKFIHEEYLGSGKILKSAIEKYGRDNFRVELLEEVDGSRKDLDEREKFWIKELNAVESDNYYNLHPGGRGGSSKGIPKPESWKRKMSDMQKDGKSWMNGKRHSEETKHKMSKSHSGSLHPMYGKHHSEKSKKLMSEAKKRNLPPICGSGSANPMTGRVWVTDGSTSKAIKRDELEHYLSLGFKRGRVYKSTT